MAVLPAVLKLIGIILLCVLGVLLVALLLVLFVPVRYKVKLRAKGSLQDSELQGRLSFLWFVLRARVDYPSDRLYSVRLFGFPVFMDKGDKESPEEEEAKKPPKAEKKEEKEFSYGDPVYVTPEEMEWGFEAPGGEPSFTRERKCALAYSKIRGIYDRIQKLFGRLQGLYALLERESTGEAAREVLFRGKKMLYSIRPRRLEGELTLGLSDPASTGLLFGAIALVDTDRLVAVPEFEQESFTGEALVRGRIVNGILLYHGLRILFKPEVQKFREEFSRWIKEGE